ncbi:MAG TPA: hypothetical protein VH419_15350 [Nocardioidaceae bacterium]|jgi:hypothetical protein
MKAVTIAAFGLGYVFGTKAGRERYAQILEIAEKASRRLETYGNGGERSSAGDRTDRSASASRAS